MIIKALKQDCIKFYGLDETSIENYGYTFTDAGIEIRVTYTEQDDSTRVVSRFYDKTKLDSLIKGLVGDNTITPFELLFG